MNDHRLEAQLRRTDQSTPNPTATARTRTRILNEFDHVTTEPIERFKRMQSTHPLFAPPMFAATLVSIIIALGLGVTAVANAAKPGDALFPWDQAAERVRLALTFGAEAKATYTAQVAEERVQEQLTLENEQSTHVDEASTLAGTALDRAITTVGEVKDRIDDNPGKAAQTLTKVETRLRELRDQHDERNTRLRIEAEMENGKTNIHVTFGRSKWEWRSTAVTTETIVAEIVAKTGLAEADVRNALVLKTGADDANDGPENGNVNRGTEQNENTNAKTNRNTNISDGRTTNNDSDNNRNGNTNNDAEDNRAETIIRVRVDLVETQTEIRTVVSGRQQEWTVTGVDQTTIIASIVAHTGLTAAEITTAWDFEQR